MGILGKLFGSRKQQAGQANSASAQAGPANDSRAAKPAQAGEHLMLSQYAAFYVYNNSEEHKAQYIDKLTRLGFDRKEAEALFGFECDILRKYNKRYLLLPGFTKMWFFGLSQPFFLNYPKEKEDILKERFLTLSELCKIIDEAEWHFVNSHERQMPDAVWQEISAWRLKGAGAEFAMKYFAMVARETGIPEMKIASYSSNEGRHLSLYKWG